MPYDYMQLRTVTVSTTTFNDLYAYRFPASRPGRPEPKEEYHRGEAVSMDGLQYEFIHYLYDGLDFCSIRKPGSRGRGRTVRADEINPSMRRRILIETCR